MSPEDQEQRKQISSGTLISVLSEMQKIITECKYGMPDYIDKILMENCLQAPNLMTRRIGCLFWPPVDREFYPKVQHIPPTLEQTWIGIVDTPPEITRDIVSRDTRSSQTSRDIGSLQTNKDVGSCIKIIADVGSDVSKDETFSVGELFRNRKRHLSNADANDPTTPPIKMSLRRS